MAKDRPKQPGKKGRKVRIDLRKNRAKPTRDKSEWTKGYHDGDVAREDTAGVENVRAKGDLSRKRTIVVDGTPDPDIQLHSGTVVRLRGLVAEVDDGKIIWACTVRRMLRTRLIQQRHPIAVGDKVKFQPVKMAGEQSTMMSMAEEMSEGVIDDVEPRKTILLRKYERKLQAVAVNVELVVIVVAADQPPLRPHLIDRYLVSIHQGDMTPLICINKADLDVDGIAAVVAQDYCNIGYQAVLTCTQDGRGLDELRERLKDHTSVFVGPSGVGKSSLLNAFDPALKLAVGTLSDLERGRHTTTTASLLRWRFGGYVVDTPGIRQFEPADVEPEELEAYFREFVPLVPQCRFKNCSHTHEVGCAIHAAVEEGMITHARYESYCKMYEECKANKTY